MATWTGCAGGAAGRLHRVPAGLHAARAGDERRVRPGGRGVRRCRPPRAHHHRRPALPGDAAVEVEGMFEIVREGFPEPLPPPYRRPCPTAPHPQPDPASPHRRDPGGGLGRLRGRRPTPSSAMPSCRAVEDSGSASAAHRMAAAARGAARRRRGIGGRRADVCQVPQLRRIRVRPRLGQCVRARRAATITRSCRWRCRSARSPGRRLLCRPGVAARGAGPGAGPGVRRAGPVRRARHVLHRGRSGRAGRAPAGCSGWASSSIGRTTATRCSTTSSARSASRKRKILRRERRDAQ